MKTKFQWLYTTLIPFILSGLLFVPQPVVSPALQAGAFEAARVRVTLVLLATEVGQLLGQTTNLLANRAGPPAFCCSQPAHK